MPQYRDQDIDITPKDPKERAAGVKGFNSERNRFVTTKAQYAADPDIQDTGDPKLRPPANRRGLGIEGRTSADLMEDHRHRSMLPQADGSAAKGTHPTHKK